MLKKIVKKIIRVFFLINLSDFSYKRKSDADIIIWIPNVGLKYMFSDLAVRNFGWITALSKIKKQFKIYKKMNIGKFHNKTIVMEYHRNYLKKLKFYDYSNNMQFLIKQLEKQGNKVIPSSSEVAYWENKKYMSREFKKLNISTPKTYLKKNINEVLSLNLIYPFLIKEEHSASSFGVHKIENEQQMIDLLQPSFFKNNEVIIVQELLNIRKDLRVIFVGNQIVHHYWRINNDNDWKPTSTGQGSSVDFNNFPEKWRSFLISEFNKMDLSTGAFDVAFENDNLDNIPLILEVSPNYQLNPKISHKKHLKSYGAYKKSLIFNKNSYDYQFIKQTFNIIEKLLLSNLTK